MLAALGNEASRTVFAYAALGRLDQAARGELNARERRAVEAWVELGVLVEGDDGSLAVDGAALRAPLAPPEHAQSPEGVGRGPGGTSPGGRAGVGRFLDGPRITAMPAAPTARDELLRWVRDHALEPGEVLTEAELNQRLRVFHPDVAMLRRYLVDAALLERTASSSEYAIPED
ncbi:DUF2087 domain-containing protein [Citricoccus sp. SGAir0253]|uniref:DUF2087 domain-containing protein n=1 Tax=Citricoccus sp. SGAir0253 TaxID=2567881 RepID=UPI0010CCF091|nr:DUF2087 domain-containing protein [Citricoccus sp. SGAir0253]QCU79135.1 DUF2087 domain-containing protein [Citricoccus sp. SGAir0253]